MILDKFLLKNARLVKVRKDGRWMYYRLNRDQEASEMAAQALEWIIHFVSNEPVIKADREKLDRLLSEPLETACSR